MHGSGLARLGRSWKRQNKGACDGDMAGSLWVDYWIDVRGGGIGSNGQANG